MNKYKITGYQTRVFTIEIEANDWEEAEEIATNKDLIKDWEEKEHLEQFRTDVEEVEE